jgi:hypothetical protein
MAGEEAQRMEEALVWPSLLQPYLVRVNQDRLLSW